MGKRRPILAALIGFACLNVFLFLIPTYPRICKQDDEFKTEHCTPYHIPPFVYTEILEFLNYYSAALTALATIAVGIFTWQLKRSTDQLWLSGERQIEAAIISAEAAKTSAESLQIVERAHIAEIIIDSNIADIFAQIGLAEAVPITVEPRVRFKFKNYGKTPATVIRYYVDIVIYQEAPSLESTYLAGNWETGDPLSEHTLGALGETSIMPLRRKWGIEDNLKNSLVRALTNIWFIGYVIFEDVFGVATHRRFIWKYERHTKQLVLISAQSERKKSAQA